MTFKLGDMVVCTSTELPRYAEYEVHALADFGKYVQLKGLSDWWSAEKFQLANAVAIGATPPALPQTSQAAIGKAANPAPFNPGDVVKCISQPETSNKIQEGQTYVVAAVRPEIDPITGARTPATVRLQGIDGWWKAERFELLAAANVGPDPSKPFPDPEADAAKTAVEKLREYRKGLRDLIGDY